MKKKQPLPLVNTQNPLLAIHYDGNTPRRKVAVSTGRLGSFRFFNKLTITVDNIDPEPGETVTVTSITQNRQPYTPSNPVYSWDIDKVEEQSGSSNSFAVPTVPDPTGKDLRLRFKDDNFSLKIQITSFIGSSSTAPVANAMAFSVDEDSLHVATFDVTGGVGSLSYEIVTNPTYGSVSFQTEDTFEYRPTPGHITGTSTSDSFTFRVDDGVNPPSAAATVSITIVDVNQPPVATEDELEVGFVDNDGTSTILYATFTDNVTDPDGDLMTLTDVRVASGSTGSIVDNTTTGWVYTPAGEGPQEIEYDVSDGTVTQTFLAKIFVNPSSTGNNPIVGTVGLGDLENSVVKTIRDSDLLINSSSPIGLPLSISAFSKATGNGTLTEISAGMQWEFLPEEDDTGSVTFDFTVYDGTNSVASTASLNIFDETIQLRTKYLDDTPTDDADGGAGSRTVTNVLVADGLDPNNLQGAGWLSGNSASITSADTWTTGATNSWIYWSETTSSNGQDIILTADVSVSANCRLRWRAGGANGLYVDFTPAQGVVRFTQKLTGSTSGLTGLQCDTNGVTITTARVHPEIVTGGDQATSEIPSEHINTASQAFSVVLANTVSNNIVTEVAGTVPIGSSTYTGTTSRSQAAFTRDHDGWYAEVSANVPRLTGGLTTGDTCARKDGNSTPYARNHESQNKIPSSNRASLTSGSFSTEEIAAGRYVFTFSGDGAVDVSSTGYSLSCAGTSVDMRRARYTLDIPSNGPVTFTYNRGIVNELRLDSRVDASFTGDSDTYPDEYSAPDGMPLYGSWPFTVVGNEAIPKAVVPAALYVEPAVAQLSPASLPSVVNFKSANSMGEASETVNTPLGQNSCLAFTTQPSNSNHLVFDDIDSASRVDFQNGQTYWFENVFAFTGQNIRYIQIVLPNPGTNPQFVNRNYATVDTWTKEVTGLDSELTAGDVYIEHCGNRYGLDWYQVGVRATAMADNATKNGHGIAIVPTGTSARGAKFTGNGSDKFYLAYHGCRASKGRLMPLLGTEAADGTSLAAAGAQNGAGTVVMDVTPWFDKDDYNTVGLANWSNTASDGPLRISAGGAIQATDGTVYPSLSAFTWGIGDQIRIASSWETSGNLEVSSSLEAGTPLDSSLSYDGTQVSDGTTFKIGTTGTAAVAPMFIHEAVIFNKKQSVTEIHGKSGTVAPPAPDPVAFAYLDDSVDNVPEQFYLDTDGTPLHKWPRVMCTETKVRNKAKKECYGTWDIYGAKFADYIIASAAQSTNPNNKFHGQFSARAYQGNAQPYDDLWMGYPFGFTGSTTVGNTVHPGHWQYARGTTLTQSIGTGNNITFTVADGSRLKFQDGGKTFPQPYAVIYDAPVGSFANAEHVRIKSVSGNSVTIDFRGGPHDPYTKQQAIDAGNPKLEGTPNPNNHNKSTARSHGSGSIIALHYVGQTTSPLKWAWGHSSINPIRDNAGRTVGEAMAKFVNENKNKDNNGNVRNHNVNGLLSDADAYHPQRSKVDPDNDGFAERHGVDFTTGESMCGEGIDNFYQTLRTLEGPNFCIVGGYFTTRSFDWVNGTQLEGFPTIGNEEKNADTISPGPANYGHTSGNNGLDSKWSLYMLNHLPRANGQRMYTECLSRMINATFDLGKPAEAPSTDAPNRLGLGLACMGDGYYGVENEGYFHPWFDEYSADSNGNCINNAVGNNNAAKLAEVIAAKGWLGLPTEQHRRLFTSEHPQAMFEPDQNLLANGGFETNIAGWSASNMSLSASTDAYAGSQCLRATVSNFQMNEKDAHVQTSNVTLKNNTEYTFSAMVKADAFRSVIMKINGESGQGEIIIPNVWFRLIYTFKTTSAGAKSIRMWCGRERVAFQIDDAYLFEGNANVFRRNFDNGTVIVNATPSDKTVAIENGVYKRLTASNTTSDALTNTGANVNSDTLVIPAYDAAFLIKQ